MRNPIRRIKPERTGVRAPLGDLEKSIMRCLWETGEDGNLAADVQRALEAAEGRRLAITTVLTTLDRLAAKGIVRREPEGRANRFYPAITEEALEQRIVAGVLDDLIAQFPHAVATYLAQDSSGGESGSRLLGELTDRVRALQESVRTDGSSAE